MPITILDGILIVVVLGSALLAMMRGFVREVLSIASWIAAAAGTYFLYPTVLPLVREQIATDIIAIAVTVGVLFLVILLIVSFITMRISDFVLDSKIGALDRSLGFIFGAARGLLLVVIAVLFFDWFLPVESPNYPRWVSEAKSKPILDSVGTTLLGYLPADPESDILDKLKNRISAERSRSAGTQPKEPETSYKPDQRQELEQLIDNSQNTGN